MNGDEELEELNSPLTSIIDKLPLSPTIVANGRVNGKYEKESYGGVNARYELLHEGNNWLWYVSGVKILVDPILMGNLDFGIPWFYDAVKKFLKNFKLTDLLPVDCLLITQSLDDHCHLKTLKPLSETSPNLRVIATPNGKALLEPLFRNVS
ncbi:hypothetical protein REPUB_Repub15cG0086000 [Reevesia pubescens]